MTGTQRKEGNLLNLTIALFLLIFPKSKKTFYNFLKSTINNDP